MQLKRRNFLLSLAVISSLVVLSFRDTANCLHTLLHQIPNPFHYHTEYSTFYHHHSDPRQSFFAHGHSHGLEDHVHAATEEKAMKTEKQGKQETKKVCEKNWFYTEPDFSVQFFPLLRHPMGRHRITFFVPLRPSPPSPPPEVLA